MQQDQRAFTIIELIIAIAVLSFGVVLVYGAFFSIINSTFSLSSRYTAIYLGQEGLEIVKNITANNVLNSFSWDAGLSGNPCQVGCMVDYKTQTNNQIVSYNNDFLGLDSDNFYSINGSVPTIFQRKITINPVNGNSDILNVSVEVFWIYSGKSFTYKVTEYLYNWQ